MENVISYAGFWKRFLAHFLDQLIIGFACGIILIPVWILGILGYVMEHGNEDFSRYTHIAFQHYHDNEFSVAMFSV